MGILLPMIQPIGCPKAVNETYLFTVYNFFNSVYQRMEDVVLVLPLRKCWQLSLDRRLRRSYQYMLTSRIYGQVDVRNVAPAHIIAMTKPEASGQRILQVVSLISPQLIVNIIRKTFPELRSWVMEGTPRGADRIPARARRSLEELSSSIALKRSVMDAVKSPLELESKWEAWVGRVPLFIFLKRPQLY